MTIHFGNVDAGSTLYIPFATYDANGASVTLTGLAVTDIEIYKNGSVTQRASDNGYALLDTDGIDFDGLTGIHGFSVDLSDNSDSGFYAAGSFYWVVVSAVTVSSQTVSFIAATFRIGPVAANVTQFGGSAGTFASGIPEVKVNNIAANAITATSIASDAIANAKIADGALTAAKLASDCITAAKLASDVTTELQSGLATAAALDTVDNFLDTEVAAILAAVDTEVAAIKAVTDALPNAGALTSLATQASVNTIDDFLDTEISAIKAKTDQLTFTNPNSVDATATLDSAAIEAAVDAALDNAIPGTPTAGSVNDVLKDLDARLPASGTIATAENVSAVETDTQDIQSRVPAALNNGCMPSDIQRINDVAITGDGSGTPFNV